MKWDPKDYTVDDALNDMLVNNGKCDEVLFTEDGVMKAYTNDDDSYKITEYISADNAKGHNSYDFYFDSNGNMTGAGPHKNNG